MHASPIVSDPSDDAWSATLLISFDKLLHSHFVDVDSFNRVSEHRWIFHLQNVVLSAPVAILRPLSQEKIAAVLRLHVVHLLNESIRHLASAEDSV